MKAMMKLTILTVIAVSAIALVSQNAASDPAVPFLDMTFVQNPIHVGTPCPPTLDVDLIFENNSGAAITVDWTSAHAVQDPLCVTDWNPKSGTTPVIAADGGTHLETITLNFPVDCSGASKIVFRGEIVGTPADFDSETLTVFCNKKVPSLTTWGAAILVALILISGLYIIRRRRVTA